MHNLVCPYLNYANQFTERMDDAMQKCESILANMQPSSTQVQLRGVQEILERNSNLIADLNRKGQSPADIALYMQELNLNLTNIARLYQLTSGSSS